MNNLGNAPGNLTPSDSATPAIRIDAPDATKRPPIDHNDAIRGDYMSLPRLRELGESLIGDEPIALQQFDGFEFIQQLDYNETAILEAFQATIASTDAGDMITPAAEWLLDNHYLVEENVRQVRRSFPKRFYRQLPLSQTESHGKYPRTLAFSWLYCAHSHSAISVESLTAFIEGFQQHTDLRIGELWAMPSMLRFVLIENLRRISQRVEASRKMRQRANELAGCLAKSDFSEFELKPLLSEFETDAAENAFASQLLYRLRDGSALAAPAIAWLEEKLELRGSDAEEVLVAEQDRLSSGNVTIGNIIRSLRKIDDIDWALWVENVCVVDELLLESTKFAQLDFKTRDIYRNRIEQLARRSKANERETTLACISLSQQQAHEGDIGFFLIGSRGNSLEEAIGYRPKVGERVLRGYRCLGWFGVGVPIILFAFLVLAVLGASLNHSQAPWPVVLILLVLGSIPATEAASGFFNFLVSHWLPPAQLPGYEWKSGVPAEARTLVAVPCLIANRDAIDELTQSLEVHYLSDPKGEVYFALLTDWVDSTVEHGPRDQELLDYTRTQIERLAQRYMHDGGRRFFLLHRRRLFNGADGIWMGWERKRGKLLELNQVLRGDRDTSFLASDHPLPKSFRYVMTLDADTRLTRGVVTKLAGKMHHPINRSVIDPITGSVESGYGVLQPRVTPSLTTGADASLFQRVFSQNRGLDPYVFTVSDTYQDLLGEGSFTGKGLYDIDAFAAATHSVIVENAVLSHDLLEGSCARAALVSDAELIEDFPTRYDVEVSRQHRWTRGDWQLLPYILGFAKGVNALGRFKMLDNLRRSLTPIFWTAASVTGWCLLPQSVAWVWQGGLVIALFVGPTLSILEQIAPKSSKLVVRSHFRSLLSDTLIATAQVFMRVAFIAHSAETMADGIVRAIYRMFVSHRNLLEWRTAAQSGAGARAGIGDYYAQMWFSPVAGALGLALVVFTQGEALILATLFSALWVAAPTLAWFVSRSSETEDKLNIAASNRRALLRYARRTWRYFETFVTAEQNYLPPDNVQIEPQTLIAERTSPTNIGLYLLSVASARDFGWISLDETMQRIEQTIATVEAMKKHNGHLYNWYATRDLMPLEPLYVSAVDSGNLAGHLVALASVCREWSAAPMVSRQSNAEGMLDVAEIAFEELLKIPSDWRSIRPLANRLADTLQSFIRIANTTLVEPSVARLAAVDLRLLAIEVSKLAADIVQEYDGEETRDLLYWSSKLDALCAEHAGEAEIGLASSRQMSERLLELAERSRSLAFAMDFGFLFDRERRLLKIGYRPSTGQQDEGCYDLLASEARLASLFAIAKGDLPTEHWFRLGRPVVPVGSRGALLSWSGSMFEYLMPPLVMHEPTGSILHQTNVLAIKRQIRQGNRLGTPWGVSESAYNARDQQLVYQYSNFGVSSLGLKRGLSRDAVVAPYASLMASQFRPALAVKNLQRLQAMGALGKYGFHDAVDFTPTRVPTGESYSVIRNFMAHHHGMSIVAVANAVFDGRMRDRFHADPCIEAVELLLQEKAPREIPVLSAKSELTQAQVEPQALEQAAVWHTADPLSSDRETVLLSNGHYSVLLTATGTGVSRWNGLSVSRWKPDPSEDCWGSFIFLRDADNGKWWSATAEPRQAAREECASIFADDKAQFNKTVGDIRSELECIVSSEGDAEGRRITLFNDGKMDRLIEVTSYSEVVLTSEETDNAHPLFAKMFVHTEISPDGNVIYARRNKRSPNEPDMELAHLVVDTSDSARPTEAETDRRLFIGRGRTVSQSIAFDAGSRLSGTDGFTLDPVFALRRTLRVPAGKQVQVLFWTIAASSRQEIDDSVLRFNHMESFLHESRLAWTRSQIQQFHIGVTAQQTISFQRMAGFLTYPNPALRVGQRALSGGMASQASLWPLSISGDFPIFLLRIDDEGDLRIIREALLMQQYLRAHNFLSDLVIVNERATSYTQDLQQAIDLMCENTRLRGRAKGPRTHIFSVRRDLMSPGTYQALLATAYVAMHTRNGDIQTQLDRLQPGVARRRRPLPLAIKQLPHTTKEVSRGTDLRFWNGFGGFNDAGNYVVRLGAGQATPHPWINVVSNGRIGFHVSCEGGGYSWSQNSRDYQLTPWTNDPVIDRPGEAFYVSNLDTGKVSRPFASLAGMEGASFEIEHCPGMTIFRSQDEQLAITLEQTVCADEPVKLSRLTVVNHSAHSVRLRLYSYLEWVLGINATQTRAFILPEWDADGGVLTATNPYSVDYGKRTAFLFADASPSSVTADRGEFLGSGNVWAPQAVHDKRALSGKVAVSANPCAAMAFDIELQPNASRSIVMHLGDGQNRQDANAIIERVRTRRFDTLLTESSNQWQSFLDTLQVKTPDPSFDLMINQWLPYQNLACRLKARAGFYQASGAFGFRDQLQDTLALMLHDSKLARTQILNAASRQFAEGDVLHWWLPGTGAGVRTMISDDVVWLGYALSHYVQTTGDVSVLEEQLPFLQGPALEPGEHDRFITPERNSRIANVYEHAAMALDLAIERTGVDGLPLILGGDWNDGMNRVGEQGSGQSVWLGWFLLLTLKNMLPLAEGRQDKPRIAKWQTHLTSLKTAIESAGWDGNYWRRGTFDDGSPLGSHTSDECRIDSLAQSWSVLSGEGAPQRRQQALDAVLDNLVDDKHKIIKLFTPPFQETNQDPGYIKAYPPGVRENGGQYTHAATWVVYALAQEGRSDEAYKCFEYLNPINHALDRSAAERYRVEPYAVAADIYGEGPLAGRGGWTWYTGSAGWLYRAGVEAILGLRRRADRMQVSPSLPSHWDGYSATLVQNGKSRHIVITQSVAGKLTIEVDGHPCDGWFEL